MYFEFYLLFEILTLTTPNSALENMRIEISILDSFQSGIEKSRYMCNIRLGLEIICDYNHTRSHSKQFSIAGQ